MLTEQEPKRKTGGSGTGLPPDSEEFWQSLFEYIEQGYVVPVIGPELLTLEHEGKSKTFYRLVAEDLLRTYEVKFSEHDSLNSSEIPCYSIPVVLRRGFEVADAVCAISKATGESLAELHRMSNRFIGKYIAEYHEKLPKALVELASIEAFNLFITTTSDDLLATAINKVRREGLSKTCEVEYAPTSLSSERTTDLAQDWNKTQGAVFYLFGKTSVLPDNNAINEEDMLEWVYNLQRVPEAGPVNLLNQIRSKSLLFIGCPINDWIGRFLVRTSQQKRFVERTKLQFMVFDPVSMDAGLKLFFERFSKNTKLVPDNAVHFVEELADRWRKLHPPSRPDSGENNPPALPRKLKGDIFISYASEDAAAAKKLCQQLRSIAGDDEIAWLDKEGGLEGGDDWNPVIKRAISKECELFIPLISKNTQQRHKGVFHREWKWAEDREHDFLGKKFIVPLLIDEEVANLSSDDLLVNERFKELHFLKAIDGILSDDVAEAFTNIIRDIRRRQN